MAASLPPDLGGALAIHREIGAWEALPPPPAETAVPVPYTLGEGQKAVDPDEAYREQVGRLYDEEILPGGSATLWSLDGKGQNGRIVSDRATLEKEFPPRLEALFRIRRGKGAPEPPLTVERSMDRQTREEFRSLGYLR